MKKSDFYYDLPEELIAQTPVEPRDSSRLLVYHKESGVTEHKRFYDIPDYLREGDLLVANNTRVIPARLYGVKRGTGGKMEFLLQKRLSIDTWEALAKPAKRAKEGAEFEISGELSAVITKFLPDGGRIVKFKFDGVFEDILSRAGETPLPHYIKEKLSDPERYQTVYSAAPGSSAAPTAGLHFTPALIDKLKEKGVEWAEVTLHVGLGTFRPVSADNIEEHKMHTEYYEISLETAEKVNKAKREGRRVIAVGTTSVRVLESAAQKALEYYEKGDNSQYYVRHNTAETNIFIYPSYNFKVVDAIITNFHLPESTLIMLVSAFIGRDNTMALYKAAVAEKYRFFSFGDASLII